MAVLMALALGAAAATMLLAVRHRTEAAADLSALTAATHISDGVGSACRAARGIAVSMSSTLVRCTVDGDRVALDVEGSRVVVGHRFVVRTHAEAGPVTLTR